MEKDRSIYMKELNDIKIKYTEKINEIIKLNNIVENKEYEVEKLEYQYNNELNEKIIDAINSVNQVIRWLCITFTSVVCSMLP